MSVLTYKGYQGSVTFEDGSLVIQVLHIDDLITTECSSAGDVEAAFHELVDDYIATCAEIGREPNKPFKGSFNVRMTPELHRAIAYAATKEEMTLNSWVVAAVQEKLNAPLKDAVISAKVQLLSEIKKQFSGESNWSFSDFAASPKIDIERLARPAMLLDITSSWKN